MDATEATDGHRKAVSLSSSELVASWQHARSIQNSQLFTEAFQRRLADILNNS